MLVLIVVAASIAFAAFVASYQKQLQTQEAASQQRSLESLKVLNLAEVNPLPAPQEANLSNFSFVLASEYVNPSTIASFSVNGNPLRYFSVVPVSPASGPAVCYNSSTQLVVAAFEVVEVTVNTDPTSTAACGYSFFSASLSFPLDQFLQVGIFTLLQNTFTSVFLPPTAIPLVSTLAEFTGTSYRNVPVLDGSHSFQSGNASLVSWTWLVTNTTAGALPPTQWNASGEELVAPFASSVSGATYTYNVTLTVENSNGLLGIATTPYTYVT
jgi:hypothetical protein